MHTCMRGEQTIIIFGLPCWFSSSRSSGLLPCVVLLKMEHGTSACMTQPLPLLCAGQCDTSMSLIQGNFKPYCHVLSAVHLCWHVVSIPQNQITKLQNALRRRVPTMPHPPSLAEPGEQRWGSCQPDSSSVLSSHVPPTWLNMTNSPSQNKPRGVSCATADPLHAQAPLCPCANGAQHPSRPTAPIPLQKQTPNHGFYTGWMSWCIRKALFLIGIRTETAEREHELMKGTGRIFCPRIFCLVPAEKRDTLCSANELSATITVYTAASETYPCAFWHCAPQACMSGLGIKKIPLLCKRVKVWAPPGLENITNT